MRCGSTEQSLRAERANWNLGRLVGFGVINLYFLVPTRQHVICILILHVANCSEMAPWSFNSFNEEMKRNVP